jgi:hypothetical protein
VDGSTQLLEKRCLPHGDLPGFGAHVEDLSSLAQIISQCAYPRPGTEDAWCTGTAERCADGHFPEACEGHERYCAASSDESAVSGEDGEGADSGGADLDGVDVVRTDTTAGGCALVPITPARSHWDWLWVLASSGLLLRRGRSQ